MILIMDRLSFCVLGVVAALSLEGCQEKEETTPNSPLLDTRWVLVQVEETPINVSNSSNVHHSYIQFTKQSTTVGLAPCSSFGGTFSQGSTAGQLAISQQASTKTVCAALNVEDKYLNALSRTVRYEISGKDLRLYDVTNSLRPLLVFEDSTK